MTSLTMWWRRVLLAGLLSFGASALVIGAVSTSAAAGPGGQGQPCAPGVDPHGSDECETPAGSGGKGCEKGKGLHKKDGQGADCGPAGSTAPPPILGGDDAGSSDGSSSSDSGKSSSDAGSDSGNSSSDQGSGSSDDEGTAPPAPAGPTSDEDEATPTEVLGEQITAETPRGAPDALAMTGPRGWHALTLLGAAMTVVGTMLHLAGRGVQRAR